MKHIIPALTLTALAAAASAQQAAAPAGLNHNSITLSRTRQNNVLAAQINPNGSNFVIGFASGSNEVGGSTVDGQLSAGYVFKGVTQGIDATVGILQANDEATAYTLTLRRTLNEVYQGLEISAGIASTLSSAQDGEQFIFGGVASDNVKTVQFIEVAYNVNKTFQVAVGLTDEKNDNNTHTVVSVRAGF